MNEENQKGIDLSGTLSNAPSRVNREPGTAISSSAEPPKIIQWVIKYSGGLIKTREQANYFLLGTATLLIIISLYLLFNSGEKPNIIPLPPGAQIIYPEGEPPRLLEPILQ